MLVCFPSLLLIALGRFGLTLVDCGSFRLYEPQGMILAVLYAWLGFLGMMQVCNLFCYGRTNVEPVRMMMLLIPYWNLWDGPRYFRERIVGLRAQLRIWEWRVLSAGNVCIGVFAALFTLSLWIAPAEILSGVCFAGLVLSMTGSWLGLCPLLIRKLRRLKQKNPLPKPPRGVFLRLPEPLRTARRWGKQQLGGSWREAGIGLLIGLAALLVGFGPPWLANEYRWREVVREHPQLRLTRQQQLSTPLPPGPYASSVVKATDVPEHEHEERAAENRDYAMRFTGSIDPEFRKVPKPLTSGIPPYLSGWTGNCGSFPHGDSRWRITERGGRSRMSHTPLCGSPVSSGRKTGSPDGTVRPSIGTGRGNASTGSGVICGKMTKRSSTIPT